MRAVYLRRSSSLLRFLLLHELLVDVREYASAGNRCADEHVELFVSAYGEVKVTRGDTLDAEVLRGVAWIRRRVGDMGKVE